MKSATRSTIQRTKIKKLKSLRLEQRAMASGNGVYSLMQAAVGDKTLVKEMVPMVQKCKESGSKDC